MRSKAKNVFFAFVFNKLISSIRAFVRKKTGVCLDTFSAIVEVSFASNSWEE